MAAEIFIDASAWIAVSVKTDNDHQAAAEIYPNILSSYSHLVTTNLVIAEAYNIIRHELGHTKSIQFLDGLKSSRLDKVFPDIFLEDQALKILRRYSDQDCSYTDAVRFALIQERGIREAFTFDHHFAVISFHAVP